MTTESVEGERAAVDVASTRVLEIEIDSRLHAELVDLGEQEGFDAGAELVAMGLRHLLCRRCSPEQSRLYRAILHAMHEQAAALQGVSDIYEDTET